MTTRTPLNPPPKSKVKEKVVPIRRTPLGVMTLVSNVNITPAKKVQEMAAAGLEPKHISILMGVTEAFLKQHYYNDFEIGRARTVYDIGQFVVEVAKGKRFFVTREEIRAAELFLKAKAGWSEESGGLDAAVKPDSDNGDSGRRKLAKFLKFAGALAANGSVPRLALDPKPRSPD